MKEKWSTSKIYIFIAFWLASMVSVYAQFQLNIYGNFIIEKYLLSSMEFALLFTAPMIPAILLSLVIGRVSDKIGGRKVVGICLLITIIGLILRIYVDSYFLLVITMMLTGFGAIGVTVNVARILKDFFSSDKLSLAVGVFTTGSMLAQVLATSTSPILFNNINEAFIAAAVLGIIITVIWWIGLFLFKEKNVAKDDLNKIEEKTVGIKGIISNSGVWLVGICIMLNIGVIITFNTFLPIALFGRGIYSESGVGISAAMISLGNLFGAILGPIFYRKLGSIKKFLIIIGVVSAILCLFTWKLYPLALLIVGLFITGLFLGSAMPIYFSAPVYLKGVSESNISGASGLITTLQLVGAVIIPTYILAPITGEDFNLMFILAGLIMLVIPILSIFINKKIKV